MIKSYFYAWARPFDFKGVSNRKEYWSFQILNPIISTVLFIFLRISDYVINYLFIYNQFLTFIPQFLSKILLISVYLFLFGGIWSSIPLTIRRIRDVGMSWQWIFVALTPLLGNLFALVILTNKSTRLSIKEEKI